MSILHVATWAAAVGGILGVLAAVYGAAVAWRSRQSRRSVPFSDGTEVVIVVPEEERRYFLRVPPGVAPQELLHKVSILIQELEIKQETEADAG